MYNTNSISIKTNLKGKLNYDILSSVIGQLSDGIWENSRSCERYWKNLDVEMEGEDVVIKAPSYYRQLFNWSSEDDVKKYFAQKLKQIVKREQEWNKGSIKWERSCEIELDYFHNSPRVKDVYRAYDMLLNRRERVK